MRTPYPSDLTDAQWAALELLVPPPKPGGRRREVDMREIINAIRYVEATGCSWRQLPEGFPGRSIVWYYDHQWREDGRWSLMSRVVSDLD